MLQGRGGLLVMPEKLNEFEVFWQCPKCGCPNRSVTTDVLLSLSKFKCKECDKIYALRKKIIQVLCEPMKAPVNSASKTI